MSWRYLAIRIEGALRARVRGPAARLLPSPFQGADGQCRIGGAVPFSSIRAGVSKRRSQHFMSERAFLGSMMTCPLDRGYWQKELFRCRF